MLSQPDHPSGPLLDAQAALLDTVLASCPAAVIHLDLAGRVLAWSASAERLLGWPAAEVIGHPCAAPPETESAIPPDTPSPSLYVAAGSGVRQRRRRRDGVAVEVHCTRTPVRDSTGRVTGTLEFLTDLTPHAVFQEALRVSEARWRSLVENNPDQVIIADRDTTIRYINRVEHGFRMEDILGRKGSDLVAPEVRPLLLESYTRAWDGQAPVDVELPVPAPDGETVWYFARIAAIRQNGWPTGLLVVSRDLSERKKAEKDLREREARQRALLSAVPDLIFLLDHQGHFQECHAQSTASTFLPPEYLLGRSAREVFPHPIGAQVEEAVQRALRDEAAQLVECPLTLDGQPRWYETRLVPTSPDKVMAIVRDITARKQAEEERAVLNRKLLETQKLESLGVLAGGIAHDFNNLLTGILGHASLARMELAADSALGSFLEQIERGCLRAAELCKQMLAYAGKGRFVLERLDLAQVIEDITHLLQVSITKRASLVRELTLNLPPILADATQVRQVVMNLVINASEAIADRNGTIHVRTGVVQVGPAFPRGYLLDPDLPDGRYVWFEVSDNGPGMTEEVRARIFDPFFTTKFTGRGLGLAAVRGIVRGHKGGLEIRSQPGCGAAFRVLFPQADPRAAAAAPPPPTPRGWKGEGAVLVADDEEAVRAVAARMLQLLGYQVVHAADGQEAVERFRAAADAIRWVLLDLTMPRLGGEEVLAELQRLRPDVPVILMSGYTEHEIAERFADRGLAGFLQKPFDAATLLARVRHVARAAGPPTPPEGSPVPAVNGESAAPR